MEVRVGPKATKGWTGPCVVHGVASRRGSSIASFGALPGPGVSSGYCRYPRITCVVGMLEIFGPKGVLTGTRDLSIFDRVGRLPFWRDV